MKTLVVTHSEDAFQPAIDAEIAELLSRALLAAGHLVEVVRLPFAAVQDPQREFAAVRMVDFSPFADVVICLTAVASIVQHPRKIAWFDRLTNQTLLPLFPSLDDRLLAECFARYARTPDGLTALVDRNLAGSILSVPSEPDGWSQIVTTVTG